MNFKKNPIAAAISCIFLISPHAYAAGSANGLNGTTTDAGGAPVTSLIGSTAFGPVGMSGDGGDAADVTGKTIDIDGTAGTLTGTAGQTGENVTASVSSGGGHGGHGGGSAIGGISQGGNGGRALGSSTSSANGGVGGAVSDNTITLNNVIFEGAAGGDGGNVSSKSSIASYAGGGAGHGGAGGGSIIGGISQGGNGGESYSSQSANGGNGGSVSGNTITLNNVTLKGALGGNGGHVSADAGNGSPSSGGAGHGGAGGGSVIGGISQGGNGGYFSRSSASARGGNSGLVSSNRISLTNIALEGAVGGNGGNGFLGAGKILQEVFGGAGYGGAGGGSVIGGISQGGNGGRATSFESSSNGGAGGQVSNNEITVTDSKLTGAAGGNGGSLSVGAAGTLSAVYGGAGNGGNGGGSIIGGISQGGNGGSSTSISATPPSFSNGGNGGAVSGNSITVNSVTLEGAAGGKGGTSDRGGQGQDGLTGGSVFGGISQGGNGGVFQTEGTGAGAASGGHGGDVTGNTIAISGKSSLTGDIYGGYSRGGSAGIIRNQGTFTDDSIGQGGNVTHNTVTLIGEAITSSRTEGAVVIYGSIWGGKSVNGDGLVSTADQFTGNTLNLTGYRGRVSGIYNFQNYNWTLPSNTVNGDTLISVDSANPMKMDNTTHTVLGMNPGGTRLNVGDTITLINTTQGILPTTNAVQHFTQGAFLTYDATLTQDTATGKPLVLIIGKADDDTPAIPPVTASPAVKLNPQSKAWVEGMAATLAFANRGAELISYNMDRISAMSAQAPYDFTPFMITEGTSQRIETGSHVDTKGANAAIGIVTHLSTNTEQQVTLGAFFEYGQGTYNTYNSFTNFASVRGNGDTSYTGVGVLGRWALGATGLYLDASLRAGQTKNKFDAGDAIGTYSGRYDSTSTYVGGHLAGGYVMNLEGEHKLDVYGRYLWTHMQSDSTAIGNETLHFGSSSSSRIQAGARYSWTYTHRIKPYAGAAYEYEFNGKATAKAYEFSLTSPSLKGATGILEAGLNMRPITTNDALSLSMGVQGFVGKRQGGGVTMQMNYRF